MSSMPFSDVIWNSQFVIFEKKNSYNLAHLNIADGKLESESDGASIYTVIHNRTNRPICEILVSEADEKNFRAFQNALLTSKL